MKLSGAPKPKRQKLDASWKVHRRALVLDGYGHTVLSLRPGDPERFATNYYHDTWHIVSDARGGRLIGKLCWALAYQRKPGTFILIDETNLVHNPFDGNRSWPIVIANADLGVPSAGALARLKRQRPLLRKPDGTVRLATFGLEQVLKDQNAYWKSRRSSWSEEKRAKAMLINGIVCFAATSDVLRDWGVRLGRLGQHFHWGMDYEYLADGEGEVQIFRDFPRKVQRIKVIREQLFSGRSTDVLTEPEAALVYERDLAQATASREKNRNRL